MVDDNFHCDSVTVAQVQAVSDVTIVPRPTPLSPQPETNPQDTLTPDLYQAPLETVEFTPRPIDRAHATDFPDFMGYRPSDARTVSWVDRDL
ncbi:hypothetical protein SNOG_16249 [Parastagonospora nodorum SN15]|uniref:Uncharacterized protein n=2 Tax=Phaeosphaeria nodorum (strain SN15 / ATCC MYA-4574 / FGSC 10173) TaxID=321614 RepID=Q0TWD6_PHANO|nr:hypothetical protein SNOG_16249 [Parastagonospora nodorum SN15]EAT76433.1 hypothetical protein SNOG_16249 [Parastagonospora nodorum SN15]